jgi:3-oxoacyl-[acyl-carrier protein] reductase
MLKNGVALITGSSSGIGAGVALAYANAGAAAVILNYPTPAEAEAAQALAAAITATGCEALAVRADVALEEEAAALAAAALARFGRVDILVNNAGIAHTASIEDMTVAAWDRVIAVHLRSTFMMTHHLLPGMYARDGGRIINTTSQLAYKGAPGLSAYVAAKGAILSFTRALALEIGTRGVRANCVAPGATRTPILDSVSPDILDAVRAAIPTGRLAEVADIVPTYVFLASEESRHYQGQCLSPNGGDQFL